MQTLTLVTTPRVYIVDNNVNALGIRALFSGMLRDVQICGMTNNFAVAYDQIGKYPTLPDLFIGDINLGEGTNLEPLKQLNSLYPKLRMLILSAENERRYAIRALRAGALGYVLKTAPFDFIVKQIRDALTGKAVVSEEIARYMATNMVGRRHGELTVGTTDALSDREHQVLTMIGHGKGTRQMAVELNLSIKTIESHRAHIKEKPSLRDATELLRFAYDFIG